MSCLRTEHNVPGQDWLLIYYRSIAVSYHFRHRCSVCRKRSHQKGTRHKVSRKRNKRNVINQHYFPLLPMHCKQYITITVSNKTKSRNQLVKAPYSLLHCNLIFRTLRHNILKYLTQVMSSDIVSQTSFWDDCLFLFIS